MKILKNIVYKLSVFKRKGALQGKIPFCLNDSRDYFTYFNTMRIKKNSLRKPICFVTGINNGIADVKVIVSNEGWLYHPVHFGKIPVDSIRGIKTPPLLALVYYFKFGLEEFFKSLIFKFNSKNIIN